MFTQSAIKRARKLKTIAREQFAWPGGYALFAITHDGACICRKCCRGEFSTMLQSTLHSARDGWEVAAIDCAANYDEVVSCAHCGADLAE